MRLEKINLVGFKSFSDPTTILFSADLTAIVGPNGCGKSNVIDAIRWVMGESAAKQLRSESLSDVIFHGATMRKPSGKTSVELLFDNTNHSLSEQYTHYDQLSVRREMFKNGQSTYFINGTRCRRQDITDIFLGTGLGHHSYAIIQQGMVTEIIEASPEALRFYLEEVAGISKYKERRRETELHIQHTKNNLIRLNDSCKELRNQYEHLQKQAVLAERYKVLRKKEALLKIQIQVSLYRQIQEELREQTQSLHSYESQFTQVNALQKTLDAQLIKHRNEQNLLIVQDRALQSEYYEVEKTIIKLEGNIQTFSEQQEQWKQEQEKLIQTKRSLDQELVRNQTQQGTLHKEIDVITPALEQAKQIAEQSRLNLKEAETALRTWQNEMDNLNQQIAQINQKIQVEQTHIQYLKQQSQLFEKQIESLAKEHQQQTEQLAIEINTTIGAQLAEKEIKYNKQKQVLVDVQQQIKTKRQTLQELTLTLDNVKNKQQKLYGQQASLESLQRVALNKAETFVSNWLQKQNLAEAPRLAQVLQVETGWEKSIEIVLDRYLQSVCTDNLSALHQALPSLQGHLNLINLSDRHAHDAIISNAMLASKIQAPWSVKCLLIAVYVADNIDEALALLSTLRIHESVITRNGIWLGHGWICAMQDNTAQTGIIQRERELRLLNKEIKEVQEELSVQQKFMQIAQEALQALEEQYAKEQKKQQELSTSLVKLQAKQQLSEEQVKRTQQRIQHIEHELCEYKERFSVTEKQLQDAQHALNTFLQAQETALNQKKEQALQTKNNMQLNFDIAQQRIQRDEQAVHQFTLQLQAARLQFEMLKEAEQRFSSQQQALEQRQQFLQKSLSEKLNALTENKKILEIQYQQRQHKSSQLHLSNQQVKQIEQQLKELEEQQKKTEKKLSTLSDQLQKIRLHNHALLTRADVIKKQIVESGYSIDTAINMLASEITVSALEEQQRKVTQKIERLEPINLAAINECQAIEERLNYLDMQNDDLTTALKTLKDVIHKMDHDTCICFKEVFDKINLHFQELFPHLFSGGKAELCLQSDDWFKTGIQIMVQPPGKRNGSIHLLSGAEKTLTAIALIFSFFQLNPAPFCLLDEVDAPLDDANVSRFCSLLKEMSKKTQFIFISHNKLAIEMAQHLIGITMTEPGVSRLVSVDIEATVAMMEN